GIRPGPVAAVNPTLVRRKLVAHRVWAAQMHSDIIAKLRPVDTFGIEDDLETRERRCLRHHECPFVDLTTAVPGSLDSSLMAEVAGTRAFLTCRPVEPE